ncbi:MULTISPECIES: precorrin-3B synthase [unclassified Modestobacter]|uniref:precorrin-3B synthase n=1 Tax=unclassified Modestobacter TaxID=2643866 RepID=UPI0022AA60D0|nr:MULTISPECIES: precorrin-3B synthase [unclassified Modestobacter]MCZ2825393.1 precorrin-3B synthase [Modestobacter sp. VKM Ac-2981]MCZ2853542.1 precorrin-3B synthase [Modestobacter sp. VKM Ac-2982]
MSFPGTSLSAPRERADACPGALQTHAAADGGLARVRVPGGAIGAVQLQALAAAARELGNGHLELTSRGNVQLRGLPAGAEAELGDRLAAAGLLPSATHERVRNVLASTLSGRTAGGHVDVRPWVGAFDAGLCADPALAELPGRFLLTLDDGRGDVAGLGGDVGLLALSADSVALLLGGVDSGLRCAPDDAVALALDATRAFLAERTAQGSTAWRLTELADGPTRVAALLRGQSRDFGPSVEVPGAPVVGPVGATTQLDGRTALIGVVPLGRLTADQADLLARLAAEVQLTPWRSVVVPDLAEDAVDDAAVDLFRTGMVFDEASPWLQVTTCAGRPGCAKSLADVRADAVSAVSTRTLPAGGARQHWAGCERRCGRPQGGVVDVVATPSGYELRIEED